MQVTPSAGLSVGAALVSVAVAAFAWRRRGTPGATPVVAFTLGTAVWTGGNALQSASTTLHNKLFWVDVQYVGIVVVPLAWFAFACQYADREEWADCWTLALLGAPLAVLLVLAWTNDAHHLVRTASDVVEIRGNATLRRTFGPAFWVGWVYSNLLTGVGTVLLLRKLVRSQRVLRRQAFAVLAGVTVPWVASGMFYNGLIAVEPELFFGLSGAAFAYAIAQHDLLDVVPVGRNVVVERMEDGVVVLDGDGRIVDANPAAGEVFGCPHVDAVIGRELTDFDVPHEELLGGSDDAVAVTDEDGIRRHYDVRRSSLSDATAAAAGTVLLLRDVTELKRQEDRLERKNERLERVGETIAHDLRNPLNVAQGRLELAMEAGDDEHLAAVEDAHERIDDIIDQVLAMARDEEVDGVEPVDLREVAADAWGNVETGDAALDLDADASVIADASELTSAFENLFRNAVEHGSTGPRSRAHGEDVERRGDDLTVRVGELDDGSGFYVEDDGVGLPEDDHDRVFETGFTTRDDGNGVGLTVVGDVAERHGWTVEATESEAGGARFEVRGVETAAVPVRR